MAVMTLAVIEGMAQAAYYIAYGEFNGGGDFYPSAVFEIEQESGEYGWVSHPYYGFTAAPVQHELNRAPPPRRQDGVVLIGLLGGSVAWAVKPYFQNELEAWFQDNDIPLRPVVLEMTHIGMKQPQQVIIVANTLSMGGEYDIIVNLDGNNELVTPEGSYFHHGLSPFYPFRWHRLQSRRLTNAQIQTASRIITLRQRQQRLDALAAAEPWRRSALYGIVNRYLRERVAGQILALNHELDNTAPGEYSLRRYGPVLESAPDKYDLSRMALRVWYRGSVMLHNMSRIVGAEYYHFLQPSQYVADSKPLTDVELARAYDADSVQARAYPESYPLMRRLGDELRQQGINYYDLMYIFADNRDDLYIDTCCHVNRRGKRIMAAYMVQQLAPALRNRVALDAMKVGGGGGVGLYPATQETSPSHAINKLYFDVRLSDADTLRYSRDDCRPADIAAPFFVRITPVDGADLRSEGAAVGYNSDDFIFDRAGGTSDAAGRCIVEYELPDYGVANILTGQYIGDTEQLLWQARITLDFGFEVARTAGGALRYSRDNCLPIHIAANFFLHITPADTVDLRPERVVHGYNNFDFSGFRHNDGLIDAAGRCVIERELPDYDIASILTGQFSSVTGRRMWETRIDFEPP